MLLLLLPLPRLRMRMRRRIRLGNPDAKSSRGRYRRLAQDPHLLDMFANDGLSLPFERNFWKGREGGREGVRLEKESGKDNEGDDDDNKQKPHQKSPSWKPTCR